MYVCINRWSVARVSWQRRASDEEAIDMPIKQVVSIHKFCLICFSVKSRSSNLNWQKGKWSNICRLRWLVYKGIYIVSTSDALLFQETHTTDHRLMIVTLLIVMMVVLIVLKNIDHQYFWLFEYIEYFEPKLVWLQMKHTCNTFRMISFLGR